MTGAAPQSRVSALPLSPREKEIVTLLPEDLPDKTIGESHLNKIDFDFPVFTDGQTFAGKLVKPEREISFLRHQQQRRRG